MLPFSLYTKTQGEAEGDLLRVAMLFRNKLSTSFFILHSFSGLARYACCLIGVVLDSNSMSCSRMLFLEVMKHSHEIKSTVFQGFELFGKKMSMCTFQVLQNSELDWRVRRSTFGDTFGVGSTFTFRLTREFLEHVPVSLEWSDFSIFSWNIWVNFLRC